MIKDVKVHVVQSHSPKCLLLDNKKISELPKSSKKNLLLFQYIQI